MLKINTAFVFFPSCVNLNKKFFTSKDLPIPFLPDKSIFDGNLQIGGEDFTIGAAYVPVYQTLLMTVYAAYFAGRSIEKVKQVAK